MSPLNTSPTSTPPLSGSSRSPGNAIAPSSFPHLSSLLNYIPDLQLTSTILAPSSLNPDSALNCTPSRPTVPINLGGPSYASDDTGFAVYDGMLSRSIPFILAFWSNSTIIAANGGQTPATPWADSRVGCVRPSMVRAGSRGLDAVSGASIIATGRKYSVVCAVASLAVVWITSRYLL